MTIIDDHEHVIDCIKFAPVSACKIIANADYSKMALENTNGSGNDIMDETTGDSTLNLEDT